MQDTYKLSCSKKRCKLVRTLSAIEFTKMAAGLLAGVGLRLFHSVKWYVGSLIQL